MQDQNKANETIKYGKTLVDRQGTQIGDWRTRELGLNCVLFGLAEIQAHRVAKLAGIVEQIEDKLFNQSLLEDLPPDKVLILYRLSRESLDTSYNYIRQMLEKLNWNQFETALLTVQSADSSAKPTSGNGQDLSRLARELLEKMNGPMLRPEQPGFTEE